MRSAIILVGGEASRAGGREKYFFLKDGKTFIEHILGALRQVVDEGVRAATCRADGECHVGRLPRAAGVADLLAGRDRTLAGRTAPAQGLCLLEVFYGRSDQ